MDVNVEAIYGLTPMQEGMLFHKIADAKDTSYHIQNAFWMNECIQLEKIEQVLELLAIKHEVFRTAFAIPKATGVPWQVILKNRSMPMKHITAWNEKEEVVLKRIKEEDLRKGFDLQSDCLIRLQIVSFHEKRHYFLFSFHHIIMDGWCLSVVIKDFFQYYKMLTDGMSMEKLQESVRKERSNVCSYQDYIKWREQQDYEEGMQYWKNLLADYNEKAEVTPFETPEQTEEQVHVIETKLSEQETMDLVHTAQNNKVTTNVIAEAAWGIALQRYIYSNDVVYGKVVSGRNVPLKGIDEKVGLFINSIPVRVTCTEDMKVSTLLTELSEQDINSSSFEYCSLADIQGLSPQGSNLIKTMFVYENYYTGDWSSDKYCDAFKIEFADAREQTNYELSVSFSMDGTQLAFTLMYQPARYSRRQMEYLAEGLKNILVQMGDGKDRAVKEIRMITEKERETILHVFNEKITFHPEKTIVNLFEEQVSNDKGKTALVYGNKSVSYDTLNKMVNSISGKIREMGVEKGDIVAVFAERRIETIAAIYAVLKAGAVYVPIDPKYPESRIQYILEDCKPKLLLKDNSVCISKIPSIDILNESVWAGEQENPKAIGKPHDLAYLIYTSGTTGKPKGVMVEHKGVVNLKQYFIDVLGIRKEDIVLQFANIVFDASVWEMTMGLLTGATLVIPTPEEQKNNEEFIRLVKREKITVATLPPIFYVNVEEFRPRLIITAGSESSLEIVKKGSEYSEYINAYGPTEFTVCASHWKYEKGQTVPVPVPIGKPILNTNLYVLNQNEMCGIGIPGELCMAGAGLARGYWNREELTNEKFVDNPFGKGKMYRSGDLVRWLPDGNIEYLGRIDEQVKIRGFRIELGEIESAIRNMEQVRDTAVIAKKDKSGELALYAYLVSDFKDVVELVKKEIRDVLPEYMIPTYWMQIGEIPVTRNGKLDKRALPEVEIALKNEYVAPTTELEKNLSKIFGEVLKKEPIGMDDSFFELGGDSIKAMKLVSRLKGIGYEVSISNVLTLENVRNLAECMERQKEQPEKELKNQGMRTIKEIEEMKRYVKNATTSFGKNVLNGSPLRSCAALPMQYLLIDRNVLNSGLIIPFNDEISISKLTDTIKRLIEKNEFMRCSFKLEKTEIVIQEKTAPETLTVPAMDISQASDEVKQEFSTFMKQYMQEEEKWKGMHLFGKALYEIIAVKYADENWMLYIPFCHLCFDGMSADVLKSDLLRLYYQEDVLQDMHRKENFFHYVEQIQNGPQNINEKEMIELFNLVEFGKNLEMLEQVEEEFENVAIHLPLWKKETESEMWNICYGLFYKMICMNFACSKVATAVLFAERKFAGENYYHAIGAYLDIVPIWNEDENTFNYKKMEALIQKIEEHSINFASLIYNKKMQEKYSRIGRELKMQSFTHLPVFNFLGVFQGENGINELDEIHQTKKLTFNVDVTYNEKEIILYGFSRKGRKAEMTEQLITYLKSL